MSKTQSNQQIVLFGAGACGRYALKHLRSLGIEPVAFADNDPSKHGTEIGGVPVLSAYEADKAFKWPQWVACAISRPAALEIRDQIKSMGLRTKPLWECIPVHHDIPSSGAWDSLLNLVRHDEKSLLCAIDQYRFRQYPDYDKQTPPSSKEDTYFPNFITHRDNEHFVDLGACQGDSIESFLSHWNKWAHITAFEPDSENYKKLLNFCKDKRVQSFPYAVSDLNGEDRFTANGDHSSHLGCPIGITVDCVKLDKLFYPTFNTHAEIRIPPTYIKMDIEGAELQALWGARTLIKEHSPVLAICAYHTSDHFWEIPLLIHAINPNYKLFLRRYAEGAWELVWYAVPLERVK